MHRYLINFKHKGAKGLVFMLKRNEILTDYMSTE